MIISNIYVPTTLSEESLESLANSTSENHFDIQNTILELLERIEELERKNP